MRTRVVAVASIALALASCGGGSGSSGTPPATISNLTFSPAGAYQGSGNGTAPVSGSISFSAPAANVASVSITVISPTGQNLGTTTGVAQGAAGHTSGMLAVQGSVSTATLGKFTFQITVIDSSNQSSNTLTGMFTIAPPPWQTESAGPQLVGASTVVPGPLYEFGLNNGASVVWIFDGTTWAQSGLTVPTPRSYAALAVASDLIYVIGGDFPGTLNTGMTVVEAHNGITNKWFTLAPLNTGRGQAAAAALNGRIYAMGGWVNGMALNSVETYDPGTNVWIVSPHTLATASGTVSAVVLNGAIYVTDAHGHVDKYDSATDTWSNVVNLANGVGSAALGTDGTTLFAFGGLVNNQPNQPSAAVQSYDPAMPGPILMKASMPVAIGAPLAGSVGSTIVVIDPSSGATLQYTPADDFF